MFLAEQQATHVLLPSLFGPRWIGGPLMPFWVDQTSNRKGNIGTIWRMSLYIKLLFLEVFSCVGSKQYVGGHCYATTQHLSAVVLGVCFELQASHCNERCLLLCPFPLLDLVNPRKL
jgi:hypothetical protein